MGPHAFVLSEEVKHSMKLQSAPAEERLQRIVGYADVCELVANAFRFPDQHLAQALVGGSFLSDVQSCLADAGADKVLIDKMSLGFTAFAAADEKELLDSLKRGYSILFLAPGAETPVWPYEAAFRHKASGKASAPILFRAPTTLDVEKMMRASGLFPSDARTEPSDSVWNEFEYLSCLYGEAARALYEGKGTVAAEKLEHAHSFVIAHACMWLPQFMEQTVEQAKIQPYGAGYIPLAQVGAAVMQCIQTDKALY